MMPSQALNDPGWFGVRSKAQLTDLGILAPLVTQVPEHPIVKTGVIEEKGATATRALIVCVVCTN
jgi:hypothetical protein